MKPGDVVLLRFPQADLSAGKLRPAMVVAIAPGRHPDVLLSLITSRSVVRLARLVSVEEAAVNARLGNISAERLRRIKKRLVDWIAK